MMRRPLLAIALAISLTRGGIELYIDDSGQHVTLNHRSIDTMSKAELLRYLHMFARDAARSEGQ